jgi:EpsI family protein
MRIISGRYAVVLLLLAGSLAAAKWSDRRRPAPLARSLDTIDARIAGWTAVSNGQLSDSVLNELKPSSYLSRKYRNGNEALDLFVAYYDRQRSGESMHSPKNCLPGSGWEIWNTGTMRIPAGDGGLVTVNRYGISKGGTRMIVLYWYQSKRRIFASEYLGKLYLISDAMLAGDTAGSIVRITLPDHSDALQQAGAFATALIPHMQRVLSGD